MVDFSTPQRMSASAFVIIFMKTFIKILNVAVLLVLVRLFDSDSPLTIGTICLRLAILLGVCVGASLLLACAAYFPKKFYVNNGNLIFSYGLLQRETTTIPLSRIHSLRTNRGIWYRLLDMRGIVFDTLASKGTELELILDEADWENLIHLMDKEEIPEPGQEERPVEEPRREMKFSNLALFKCALCQNHLKGMAILGSVLLALLNQLNDINEEATDRIAHSALQYTEAHINTPLVIAGVLVAVYILVLLLWLGKVVLRYYNLSLSYDDKWLIFNHGLISRASSRFAFNKICTIWVKRNFLEKRFGLSTIMLRQALNVSAMKEEDNLKLYSSDKSSFFLKWWLGEDYALSPELASAQSGRGAAMRIIIPMLLLTVAATVVLYYYQLYYWILAPAIVLFYSIARGICVQHRSHITLRDSYIIVSEGAFADRHSYLKYANVEVVQLRSTPFTRWTDRVVLKLSTSGTAFTVRSLKKDQATHLRELILLRSESRS